MTSNKQILSGDQESKKMVWVDNRELNTPNENFIKNEIASHMSDMSDSSNQSNQTPKPPRPQATDPKCGHTDDAFHMKIHIANCEGIA